MLLGHDTQEDFSEGVAAPVRVVHLEEPATHQPLQPPATPPHHIDLPPRIQLPESPLLLTPALTPATPHWQRHRPLPETAAMPLSTILPEASSDLLISSVPSPSFSADISSFIHYYIADRPVIGNLTHLFNTTTAQKIQLTVTTNSLIALQTFYCTYLSPSGTLALTEPARIRIILSEDIPSFPSLNLPLNDHQPEAEKQQAVIEEAKRRMLAKTQKLMDERMAVITRDTDAATGWCTIPGGHQDRWAQNTLVGNETPATGRGGYMDGGSEVPDGFVVPQLGLSENCVGRNERPQPNLRIMRGVARRTDSGRAVRDMLFNGETITVPVSVGEVLSTPGPTIEQAQTLG